MNAVASRKAQRFIRLEVMRSGDYHYSDLLLDEKLSPEEKVWVLEQRIQDLDAELRAADENMADGGPDCDSAECNTAEKLREARRTLQQLQSQ